MKAFAIITIDVRDIKMELCDILTPLKTISESKGKNLIYILSYLTYMLLSCFILTRIWDITYFIFLYS